MKLQPHDKVLIGGELVEIGREIADAFVDGDRLIAKCAGVVVTTLTASTLPSSSR